MKKRFLDKKRFKIGLFVKDIQKEIEGYIIKTFGDFDENDFKIHVECKRFIGDTKPFFIEYNLDEIEKYIYPLYTHNKPHKHNGYLTIGELKKSLKRSKLTDDANVLIELLDKNILPTSNIIKTNDLYDKSGEKILDFGREYVKVSGVGSNFKDNTFMIDYYI